MCGKTTTSRKGNMGNSIKVGGKGVCPDMQYPSGQFSYTWMLPPQFQPFDDKWFAGGAAKGSQACLADSR
jgi:hypothetical protein